MPLAQALVAGAGGGFTVHALRRELGTDDAGGHGQRAPAHQHHDRGDDAAQVGLRRDVAEADGGHRRDRPVHAHRDAGVAMLRPLDHVHQGTHHQHHQHHEGHEHQDLAPRRRQRTAQGAEFGDVMGELENAEHAQQAQHPHVDQRVDTGHQQRHVGGQHGQQVDDAERAARIGAGMAHAGQPGDVFDREGQREHPFQQPQLARVHGMHGGHAVEHDHGQAHHDGGDQAQVEPASGTGVGLEDDGVHAQPPALLRASEIRQSGIAHGCSGLRIGGAVVGHGPIVVDWPGLTPGLTPGPGDGRRMRSRGPGNCVLLRFGFPRYSLSKTPTKPAHNSFSPAAPGPSVTR